jgi:hypothetical protein
VKICHIIQARGVQVVSWDDWQIIDQAEQDAGTKRNKPRIKMTARADMLATITSRST